MGEDQGYINEKRMERRFQLELTKLQSTDSLKSNLALGLYVLGATFMLGSFTMPDIMSKIASFTAGLVFAMCGAYQLVEWRRSRDKKLGDLERAFL
jgi:hypothetical protein